MFKWETKGGVISHTQFSLWCGLLPRGSKDIRKTYPKRRYGDARTEVMATLVDGDSSLSPEQSLPASSFRIQS